MFDMVQVRVVVLVGPVIIGGAEKNCGDVGGRVTGVVVRDGDGGRFEVIDVMGIAAIL